MPEAIKEEPNKYGIFNNYQQMLGGAVTLSYINDLFTVSNKESFNKVDLLILFNFFGDDLLPTGMFDRISRSIGECKR